MIDQGQMTSCIKWDGPLNDRGYGVIKNRAAHRVLYERKYGNLSPHVVLHHLCHQRGCVNLDHLAPLTRREHALIHPRPDINICRRGHALDVVGVRIKSRRKRCCACLDAALVKERERDLDRYWADPEKARARALARYYRSLARGKP